jgi:hypothetical protein
MAEDVLKVVLEGFDAWHEYFTAGTAQGIRRRADRGDVKRKAGERLETPLLGGLQRAETELTPADRSEIRPEAIAQVKAR